MEQPLALANYLVWPLGLLMMRGHMRGYLECDDAGWLPVAIYNTAYPQIVGASGFAGDKRSAPVNKTM